MKGVRELENAFMRLTKSAERTYFWDALLKCHSSIVLKFRPNSQPDIAFRYAGASFYTLDGTPECLCQPSAILRFTFGTSLLTPNIERESTNLERATFLPLLVRLCCFHSALVQRWKLGIFGWNSGRSKWHSALSIQNFVTAFELLLAHAVWSISLLSAKLHLFLAFSGQMRCQ